MGGAAAPAPRAAALLLALAACARCALAESAAAEPQSCELSSAPVLLQTKANLGLGGAAGEAAPPADVGQGHEEVLRELLDGAHAAHPTVWGPQAWNLLHCMAGSLPAQVPAQTQRSVEALVASLPGMLPCRHCGRDLRRHLARHPTAPHLATREGAVRWMIDLHNLVNKEAGKPVLSYEDALRATSRHTCGAPAQQQQAPRLPPAAEPQEAAPPAGAGRGRGARRRKREPLGDPKSGAQELKGKLAHAKDLLAKMGGALPGAAGKERGSAPRQRGPKPGGRDLLGKLGGAQDLLAKLGGAAGAEGKLGSAQDLLAKLGGAVGQERGAAAAPRKQGPDKPAGRDLLGKLQGLLGKQKEAPSAAGPPGHAAAGRDPDRVRKLVGDALPELLKVLEGSSGDDLQAMAASLPQDVVKEAMSVPAIRNIVGKALGGGHLGAHHRAAHGTVDPDTQA